MKMGMGVKKLGYFIILCSFLCNHGIQGHTLFSKSHKLLEWEKQYQLLKKPSLKTIKTEHGDIYDCVDFYKQPAFDYPLLKNHTFHPQMRPSFIPQWEKTTSPQEENEEVPITMRLKGGGCPKGTVPIRRISKDEFFKTMEFTEKYASRVTNPNVIQPQSGTNFAMIQSKSNPGTIAYHGIGGELSIYNLPVGSSQYTSGEMIVQDGDDRIQVGWTVNPALNHDNQTRLFQYLSTSQSQCFNMLCFGFVSIAPDIPIDVILEPVSIVGKQTYVIPLVIFQDTKEGNWWLAIDHSKTIIGFWPKKIFKGLATSASYVAVGGETYSPPGQPLPPMGSGQYPEADWDTRLYAYSRLVFVVDGDQHVAEFEYTEKFTTNRIYGVEDKGHLFKGFGHIIYYGGSP